MLTPSPGGLAPPPTGNPSPSPEFGFGLVGILIQSLTLNTKSSDSHWTEFPYRNLHEEINSLKLVVAVTESPKILVVRIQTHPKNPASTKYIVVKKTFDTSGIIQLMCHRLSVICKMQ